MDRFPADFAELLSTDGLAVMERKHPELCRVLARGQSRFFSSTQLIDPGKSAEVAALLDRTLAEKLGYMTKPIPRETVTRMKENYSERLPKTVAVHTGFIERPKTPSGAVAEALGLTAMLRSPSFHAFAEGLSGYPLRRKWGLQVLCYWPGEYSGPHNDHHPEQEEARDGYTDLHLTFSMPGVGRQLLVYEQRGHLSQVADVATVGGVSIYRLPFWHYTTPLEPKPDREAEARRWVLLGTFLDDRRPRRG